MTLPRATSSTASPLPGSPARQRTGSESRPGFGPAQGRTGSAAPIPGLTETLALSETSFRRFSEFITGTLGIKMPREKSTMLQSRLQRRLRQLGMHSLEDYQRMLFELPESDPEWVEFINLVTTNKTDFFREPTHFDYLVGHALPELDTTACKVWCAGCSSGEEPYTLSMVLSEYRANRPDFEFSILASDISTRVLKAAAEAIYEEEKIEPVPMALRQKYLLRSKDREAALVRIVPELRQRVRFRRLNFMDADYGLREQFHAVFFRNVMIYFSRETQQQVLQKLCAHLIPGGYLFTGHSESLVGMDLPLKQVTTAVHRRT